MASGWLGPDPDLATSCVSRVTGGEVMIPAPPLLNWVSVRPPHPSSPFLSLSLSSLSLAF